MATVYKVAKDLLGSGIDDIQLTLAYRTLPPIIKDVMIDPYLHGESDEARITVRVKETSRTLNRADLLASLDRFMQEDMGYSEDEYRFSGMLVLYKQYVAKLVYLTNSHPWHGVSGHHCDVDCIISIAQACADWYCAQPDGRVAGAWRYGCGPVFRWI